MVVSLVLRWKRSAFAEGSLRDEGKGTRALFPNRIERLGKRPSDGYHWRCQSEFGSRRIRWWKLVRGKGTQAHLG